MTRILVIEDEYDILEEISDVLRFEGFDVTTCTNGADGVLAALEIEPDLILSDIMMPQMDGMEVLQELHKVKRTRSIPFIFLTARGERMMIRQGMELGADDYLVKPFTHAELLAAVYARLRKREEFQELASGLTAAKKQFVRMIAHELRTPLAPINLVHDLLNSYLRDFSDEEVRELIDSLSYGTSRLNRVVEQIVCMVELESGLVTTEVTEEAGSADYLHKQTVAAILQSAINLGRQLAPRNRDLKINADINNPHLMSTIIEGNIGKLIYAFGELISNALAFSRTDGQVYIRFRSNSSLAYISIIDHGCGLDEKEIRRATLPFEQIDRQHKEQQGVGLGLFLASKIVRLHKGDISIHSEVNKGTKVTVKLPLRQEVP